MLSTVYSGGSRGSHAPLYSSTFIFLNQDNHQICYIMISKPLSWSAYDTDCQYDSHSQVQPAKGLSTRVLSKGSDSNLLWRKKHEI